MAKKNLKKEIAEKQEFQDKDPEVILDFEYTNRQLFIVIENIGGKPAYDIQVKFNKKIMGLQKSKDISDMKIFSMLKFLPPHKKIRIFVDLFQSYLSSKQPLKIKTEIFFKNKKLQKFENLINHDLTIYKDIPEIGFSKEANSLF